MIDRTGTYRFLQIASIMCAGILSIWIFYSNRYFFHDDAYITLRYARNFITGNGIVWNPHEYVQGYTNFLHLILVSIPGLFGVDLFRASRIIGLLSYIVLIVVLLMFTRSAAPSSQHRAIWHLPVILVMSSAPVIVWSVGGLESTLFTLLVTSGCLLFLKCLDHPDNTRLFIASGLCFGCAYLTRPDGGIFVAITIFWLLVTRKSRPVRSTHLFIISCFALIAVYSLWQFYYYGNILPNTFYAKAGNFSIQRAIRGFHYVKGYVRQPPYLVIITGLLVLYMFLKHKSGWKQGFTYLLMTIICYTLFMVIFGGDHMLAFRLLLPVIALLAYLFYLVLPHVINTGNRTLVISITAILLLLSVLQVGKSSLNPKQENPASYVGTIIGKYISEAWPPGSLVALNTAGSTPYYAGEHRYLDMLGLNDPYIAKRRIERTELPWQDVPGHLKGDGAYVLLRSPDYIIIGPAAGTTISEPWFLSDLEISRNKDFLNNYDMRQVRLNRHGRVTEKGILLFTYYARKGRLNDFPAE